MAIRSSKEIVLPQIYGRNFKNDLVDVVLGWRQLSNRLMLALPSNKNIQKDGRNT